MRKKHYKSRETVHLKHVFFQEGLLGEVLSFMKGESDFTDLIAHLFNLIGDMKVMHFVKSIA